MRILIIGASGLVGYNCYRHFSQIEGQYILGTHRNFSTDFTSKFNCSVIGEEEHSILRTLKPSVIIHTGALTNVDECEVSPEKSYFETVISTANIIKIAEEFNSKIVYISTDYVFDGESGPYHETDIPNPINTYGKHKLIAEQLVQQQNNDNLIIRITNVYGDELRDKNFVSRLLKEPTKPIELKLPVDQFATPINALDVAKAIELLLIYNKSGIYHLASIEYVNRVQMAMQIIHKKNLNNWKIVPTKTSELNQRAKRPLFGGLIAMKFLNEFPYFINSSLNSMLDG
ncbi:MAG: SDR family oxidoreductase [Saprospiraceae bacterium]